MNLYDFINKLSDLATSEDIIVPSSSGFASEITQQAWKVKHGQRIICNPGLGSMGYAIPTAIGASVASNRRVIVIEGDGSLQHSIYELATIARLNLNIKIFVINNGGFASIRNTHEKFFGDNPVRDLRFPDPYDIGKAYNIKIQRNEHEPFIFDCLDEEELELIERFLNNKYPCIARVDIDPDQKKEQAI
jgi:acetolactate synthase-1/2/3 large subunit